MACPDATIFINAFRLWSDAALVASIWMTGSVGDLSPSFKIFSEPGVGGGAVSLDWLRSNGLGGGGGGGGGAEYGAGAGEEKSPKPSRKGGSVRLEEFD